MLIIRIFIILMVVNRIVCPPTRFAALNEMLYKTDADTEEENDIQESPQSSNQQETTQSSRNQPRTIYEEYPWLDNAIALISDKLIRLLGFIVKKFIFKMDINFADIL